MSDKRYARQILMFGEEGQKEIGKQSIAIIGSGGIGLQVCQALAFVGASNFTPIDHDWLDETNMNRAAGATARDIGRPKVEVAKELILSINPAAQVNAIPKNLRTREALKAATQADMIFGCVDHDGPRLVLNDLSQAYNIPLIDIGTEIFPNARGMDFGGRVIVARPGDYCLFCADQIDRELAKEELETPDVRAARKKHGYGLGDDKPSPSVFALNGVLANAAVMEFIVMVTGIREPARRITYKGMRPVMTCSQDTGDPECFTCSNHGIGEKANIWRYLLPEEVTNESAPLLNYEIKSA